jgi:hypothetical protein
MLKPSPSSQTTRRTFSTSLLRAYIPPESPGFIDVPEPHQPVRDPKPIVKGILPVPRELFPGRRPDKPGKEYLAQVTRDPLPHNVPDPKDLTEVGRYKLRMAETRKSHLREGLAELHARKVAIDTRIAQRSDHKRKERTRLLEQPEREDARLTNNSVPSAMRPQKPHALSPEQELAIYNARKAAHEARLAEKHEDRLDRLHTLYMNARTFITDKDQLAEAIEASFATTRSIWRTGRPDTVEEMIRRGRDRSADRGRGGMMLSGDLNERAVRDQERMKNLAERLSGGKL